jgi:hypothetical protein
MAQDCPIASAKLPQSRYSLSQSRQTRPDITRQAEHRITPMKPQRRFIASITATAKTNTPSLPFQRGAPRAAMIARRNAALNTQKAAPRAKLA